MYFFYVFKRFSVFRKGNVKPETTNIFNVTLLTSNNMTVVAGLVVKGTVGAEQWKSMLKNGNPLQSFLNKRFIYI